MPAQASDAKKIFLQAIENYEPHQWPDFLDEACGKDAALRQRVDALLKAHGESNQMLDGTAAVVKKLPVAEPLGSMIGPFKLLEQIGEGGFGIVYLAEQQEPMHRRVALKIIKPGMDTREVIARFEIERQALALMDHPGIARVLDAGTTDSQRPYFVMELVKGIPVTDYCDQCHLPTRERLELFAAVCQAVQHAHQKGIIHRDIKPTNVLVAMQDGQPAVKVIDFGVAKAINQRLTERTFLTGLMQMVGTPLYMSPEQAEMGPLDIDTRSDIYSLGVLLYELLTGTTPFDKSRLSGVSYDELRRIIREDDPPKPSTRLSTLEAADLSTVADRRRTDPHRLRQSVRGDLDWIVMKALDKDRTRRYETANGLARDVERYLNEEPVEACPPSAGYRFGKFARRNRAALATVGLVAAVLVAATSVSTWQAIRAETERAEAAANLEKAKATVNRYFTLVSEEKLLDVPGLQPLREELLESALQFYRELSDKHPDDPALLGDLAATYLRLSQVYLALNRADDAIVADREALDLIARIQFDPQADQYEPKLAGFWKGMRWTTGLIDAPRDPAGAAQTLSQMEATWSRLVDRHPTIAAFQSDLSAIQALMGNLTSDPQTALAYHRKALAIDERLVKEYPDVSQYRCDLVDAAGLVVAGLTRAGKTQEALALSRRRLRISEGLVRENPGIPAYRPGLADSLMSFAEQITEDQPAEAEVSVRRAIEVAQALVQEYPDQPYFWEVFTRAVRASCDLVDTLDKKGKHSEAENLRRQVMGVVEQMRQHFPDQPEIPLHVFHTERVLAFSAWNVKRRDQAMQLFQSAQAIIEKLAPKFPRAGKKYQGWIGINLADMAKLSADSDHANEAVDLWRRAVASRTQMIGQLPEDTVFGDLWRSWVRELVLQQRKTADVDAARQVYQEVMDPVRELLDKGNRTVVAAYLDYAIWLKTYGPEELATKTWYDVLERIPDATLDYQVRIATPGQYRLYLRAAGTSKASDTVHARILETADGPAGQNADWYRYNVGENGDFNRWHGYAGFERTEDEGWAEPAVWNLSAGQYTLCLLPRESGTAVDALVLQLAALPDPVDSGPAESARTEEGVFVETDGWVAIEAEHFTHRSPARETEWTTISPQSDADTTFKNCRGTGYVQLPPGAAGGSLLTGRVSPPSATLLNLEARARTAARHPGSPKAQNLIAWELAAGYSQALRDPDRAKTHAQQAVKLSPWDSSYYNTLGLACYRAGDFEGAVRALRYSNELSPGQFAGINGFFLAMAYQRLGDVETAGKWHQAAIAWQRKQRVRDWDRFQSEAQRLFSQSTAGAESKQSMPDDADPISLVIAADPAAAWPYVLRAARLKTTGETEQAEADAGKATELIHRLVEESPDDPVVYILRAVDRERHSQFEDALTDWSQVIELSPDQAVPRNRRGAAHARLEAWEEAAADFAKAAEIQDFEVQHWYFLALAQLAAGDEPAYRRTCARMLEEFAETSYVERAEFAAWSCALGPDSLEDYAVALALAKRGAKSNLKEGSATLGAVLFRADRYDEALEKLLESDALLKKPKHAARTSPAYTWYFLAMTYQRLGKASEARSYFDRANAWTEKALARLDADHWNRRLTLQMLRREAEELLGDGLAAPTSAANASNK